MDNIKITHATINNLEKKFDVTNFKVPEVIVKTSDGNTHKLFNYYPDEISFKEEEFIGLTVEEAKTLKFEKDKANLQGSFKF